MRTVYIDVLITVNIFIDFFLLLCTKLILNLHYSLTRLIIGSAVGGVFSLVALFPSIPGGVNLLIDIVLALPIIFIAFGNVSFKTLLKRTLVFFGCSFIFCGIMIVIYTSFKPKGMEIYNNVIYFNISPILLIILTLVCYYFMKIAGRLLKGNIGRRICDVQIINQNNHTRFNAMIDTGCNVKEPFSGEYVIIAEKTLVENININDQGMRIIPYQSLGGNGVIKGFCPDNVMIDGKKVSRGLYIGICENVLKGEVKAIIPYELAKNI